MHVIYISYKAESWHIHLACCYWRIITFLIPFRGTNKDSCRITMVTSTMFLANSSVSSVFREDTELSSVSVLAVFATGLVIKVIVFIVGTTANSSVLILFWKLPRLRTWENAFHMNLAVFDIFACALVIPINLLAESGLLTLSTSQVVHCSLLRLYVLPTLGTLVCVTQVALMRAYRLANPTAVIARIFIKCQVVFPWVLGILSFIATLFISDEKPFLDYCNYLPQRMPVTFSFSRMYIYVYVICTFLSLSLLVLYIHITKVIHKRRQIYPVAYPLPQAPQNQRSSVYFVSSVYDSHVEPAANGTEETRLERERIEKEFRMITSSLILLSVHAFSMIVPSAILFSRPANSTDRMDQLCIALTFIQNATNPFIYCFGNKYVFKDGIKQFMCKSCT